MEDQIKCPKCGSTQIHADKKGFSTGKAVAGVVLAGGIGLAAGAIGKDQIVITCLKCGNQFKPGEGGISSRIDDSPSVDITYKEGEANITICKQCEGKTIYGHKYCCECGNRLTNQDGKELICKPLPIMTCGLCKQLTTKPGRYCSKCGKEKATSNSGCAGVLLLFIILFGSLIVIL